MVIICLVLPLGCAVKPGPVFVKGGREYGRIEGIWGGDFWNYYERGISYAEGEFWALAINDFRQAARLKDRDHRRTRTYGLHILDDYFPHREIGIAYYATADYQKAVQELSISLEYYPSAKAKYYLNRAREAYLRQTRQDTASPQIWITSHQDQQVVGGFEAAIEGRVRDDWFVEKININGAPYPCELAQKNMDFKATLPLEQGSNEIRVAATDLSGKESVARIHLIADRQAPVLCIDDLRIIQGHDGPDVPAGHDDGDDRGDDHTSKEIHIEGYVDDLCGVKTFQIDQQTVTIQGEKRGAFSFRKLLPQPVEEISFAAEDQLGNRVEGKIGLENLPSNNGHDAARFSRKFSSDRFMQVASLQLAGVSAKADDTQPPLIRLTTPKGNLTVDWDTLFISGEIQDAGGIRDLLVNNESILPREGKMIYFNHLLKLRPGKNSITIKAIDLAGNEKTKTIEIERKVNPIHQIASRMSMAIIPLTYTGNDEHKRELMSDLLTTAFVAQERFCMVDRQRIDRIVRQLQKGGQYKGGQYDDDPELSPLEVGKLVSAESVLAGRIYEDKGFVEIVARVIDTETSVILDSQDVYGPADLQSIKTALEGLALKFKQSFPLVEGAIVEKDGRNILVNIGKEKNIKEYTKYIVFRDGKPMKDPSTQKVLESRPNVVGEAKIIKVFDRISEADLISRDLQEAVRIKDHVITK